MKYHHGAFLILLLMGFMLVNHFGTGKMTDLGAICVCLLYLTGAICFLTAAIENRK